MKREDIVESRTIAVLGGGVSAAVVLCFGVGSVCCFVRLVWLCLVWFGDQ